MRRPNPVEALVTLSEISEPKEREVRWRQAFTALAQHVTADGPPPLDDLHPEQLQAACLAALDSGLVDDLSWIAEGKAALALYELTSALPSGTARREFARRLFGRLYGGNASTFLPVATRMALSSGKQLRAAPMRARVSLLFGLPLGSSIHADPLALNLLVRRDQFRLWIREPSTGSLPARHLAAVLVERAAREAVARYHRGDKRAHQVLTSEAVRPSFDTLYSDREPLVWRHAAIARGFLASVDPKIRQEIDMQLDPGLTPTEWRRAVVSLTPCLLWDYETTMAQCRQILNGEIVQRHAGIVSTMLWGLGPVIEADPDAAAELLALLSSCQRLDVAEAMANLLGEVSNAQWGLEAAGRMRRALAKTDTAGDVMLASIIEHTQRCLEQRSADGTVRGTVLSALRAFETEGALAAYERATEAIAVAESQMFSIRALGSHPRRPPKDLYPLLYDLDVGVLQRARLHELLLLGRRPGEDNLSVPRLDALHDDIGRWLMGADRYQFADPSASGNRIYRQKKLVSLLHLLDVETSASNEAAAERVKGRICLAMSRLLHELREGIEPSLQRVFCATLARCFDAAVREHVADAADLLLVLMQSVHSISTLTALMEASTNCDVREALKAYANLARHALGEGLSDAPPSIEAELDSDQTVPKLPRAIIALSHGVGTDGSYRGEALRQVVLRLGRVLEAIDLAKSVSSLSAQTGSDVDLIRELEHSSEALRRLQWAAQRRVLGSVPEAKPELPGVELSSLIQRWLVSETPPDSGELQGSFDHATQGLPPVVGAVVRSVLASIVRLPLRASLNAPVIALHARRAALPDWLLPRRVIGGFYVVRALRTGGGSSVFVARRVEERHRRDAQDYALKVPQYDPTVARSVSEKEFLDMFRQEATALLSLPRHRHLASFVTFDLAALPKPILVMELIRGQSLDRLIKTQTLTSQQVFAYLDGILAGLQAMHEVGVGHLDVKPSNVVLREDGTPALVDFGLSGRHIRPGCGTLEYTSPEILGALPEGSTATVAAADVYSFGCTAYELLTTRLLFEADDEASLIMQQVSHDGWPPALARFGSVPALTDLAALLGACLRRDPHNRPSATEARHLLKNMALRLPDTVWPLTPAHFSQTISA